MKADLVSIIKEIAQLEAGFKSRAYYRAAQTLIGISEQEFNDRVRFNDLPNVGSSIEAKILEFKETGVVAKLGSLRLEHQGYLDPLVYKIRKGFITKRIPYRDAEVRVLEINKWFFDHTGIPAILSFDTTSDVVVVGSMRRKKSLIADIDLIIFSTSAYHTLIEGLGRMGFEVVVSGDTKTSFKMNNMENTSIDLNLGNSNARAFQLLHHTGSVENNVNMRKNAKRHGMSLNQYGITPTQKNSTTGEEIKFETEQQVYEYLGMRYLKPTER